MNPVDCSLQGWEISLICLTIAGVSQGSILVPFLYIVYTYNIPTNNEKLTATYADDIRFLTKHEDPK